MQEYHRPRSIALMSEGKVYTGQRTWVNEWSTQYSIGKEMLREQHTGRLPYVRDRQSNPLNGFNLNGLCTGRYGYLI